MDLSAGTGTGGDAQGDTIGSIENITGSSHDDTLVGNGGANVINGGAGDDSIDGRSGDDEIDGGTGFDTLLVNGDLDLISLADDLLSKYRENRYNRKYFR